MLADDVETTDRTVRKHLKWAIDTGYLLRTRRGHRLGDGTAIASEYPLCQPETGDRLRPLNRK
jgi:hypothetical protein